MRPNGPQSHRPARQLGAPSRAILLLATCGCVFALLLAPGGRSSAAGPLPLVRAIPVGLQGVGGYATAVAVDPRTGHAFVAAEPAERYSNDPGTLTTLDLSTGAILHTASVGVGPGMVVVDSASGRVFVLNGGRVNAHRVVVTMLNAASGTLLAMIDLGQGTGVLAVDETTNRVFVTNQQKNTVSLLNATNGHLERVVALPSKPGAIAVAPTLGRVYLALLHDPSQVTLIGSILITALDASTGQPVRTTDTGLTAYFITALAVDERRGRLYLVPYSESSSLGSMTTLDAASGHLVATTPVGKLPVAIAVDHTGGRVFVLTSADHAVTALDAATGKYLATLPVGYTPRAIAADERSGRVFVVNYNVGFGDSILGYGSVTVLNGRAAQPLATISVGFLPDSLAIDPSSGQALILSSGLPDPHNLYLNGSLTMLHAHASAAALARLPDPLAPFPVDVRWLRVDPQHPQIIYIGGSTDCPAVRPSGVSCSGWVLRSSDGGATWTDLRVPLGIFSNDQAFSAGPLIIALDSRHLYMEMGVGGGSPASASTGLIRSADGGRTWHNSGPTGDYGGGLRDYVVSPAASAQVYAADYALCLDHVAHSTDGGVSWHAGPATPRDSPSSCPAGGPLVADPTRADTVYINVYQDTTPLSVLRSDDAGLSWTTVTTPTHAPPLASFEVSAAPYLGAPLIGRTADAGVPADRRWRSTDRGHTWTPITCAGDLAGVCPTYTVDNTFGAGASYAFIHDGVYRYTQDGPAATRLPISDALPARTADLLAVQAGLHYGNPIYLLTSQTDGNVHGTLYRSADRGKTWQRLAVATLAHLSGLPANLP